MMAPQTAASKENSRVIIEIGIYGGPIFLGRADGTSMREKFKLDDLDNTSQTIQVVFPDTTKGIGSSFFLAMFGASIRHAGSALGFLDKYKFSGPEFLIDDLIPTSVDRALFEGELFGTDKAG